MISKVPAGVPYQPSALFLHRKKNTPYISKEFLND